MIFKKEHLAGAGYEWNLGSFAHSMEEKVPTRKGFDRFNGNCVLHMLNLFNGLMANLTVRDGQCLEALIADELPLMLSSEITVFNWLKDKFIYAIPSRQIN